MGVKGAFIDVEIFAPFGTNIFASVTIAPHEGRIITQFDSTNLNTALATAISTNVDNINTAKTDASAAIEVSPGETINTVSAPETPQSSPPATTELIAKKLTPKQLVELVVVGEVGSARCPSGSADFEQSECEVLGPLDFVKIKPSLE